MSIFQKYAIHSTKRKHVHPRHRTPRISPIFSHAHPLKVLFKKKENLLRREPQGVCIWLRLQLLPTPCERSVHPKQIKKWKVSVLDCIARQSERIVVSRKLAEYERTSTSGRAASSGYKPMYWLCEHGETINCSRRQGRASRYPEEQCLVAHCLSEGVAFH